MKYCLILATVLIITSTVCAQNRVVNGKLTAYDSFPVMNVEITSKKAKATTMSDSLGSFSIVCLEKDVVQIKPEGFQPENNNYYKYPDMASLPFSTSMDLTLHGMIQ